MKRFLVVFLALMLLIVLCVPFAFASSETGTETGTDTEVGTETDIEYDDPLIPDTDLEGAVDQRDFLEGLENYFGVIAVPQKVTEVFNGFLEVWFAVPLVVRYTIDFGFAFACILAVFKMLF